MMVSVLSECDQCLSDTIGVVGPVNRCVNTLQARASKQARVTRLSVIWLIH